MAIALALTGSFSARAASSTPAATPIPNQFNLVGDDWKLVALTPAGKSAVAPKNPLDYTLRLTADGKALITADCNSGGGTYTLAGDKLTFSGLVTTLMGCPNGSLGSQFAQMLGGEQTISWKAYGIILTGPKGGALEFSPALTNVTWQWQPAAVVSDGTAPAISVGQYTVAFGNTGDLAVMADCNRGKTTYLTNGGALAIRGIALTKANCPEGTLANQFVQGLQASTAYQVSGGALTIRVGNEDWRFTPQPASPATATPAA